MLLTNFFVIVAFIIVAIVNLISDKRENLDGIYATKPLLMPLLALYYVLSATNHNWLIVFALICGFFGDILLMWPENRFFFGSGLIFFLVGHILYTIVFLESTSFLASVPGWFYTLLIPYMLYGFMLLKKLYPYVKNHIISIFIYMIGIISMSFMSLSRVWNIKGLSFWLPFIGSLLFIASDSILSFQSFVPGEKNPDGEVLIMSTYILAEVFIVFGFLSI